MFRKKILHDKSLLTKTLLLLVILSLILFVILLISVITKSDFKQEKTEITNPSQTLQIADKQATLASLEKIIKEKGAIKAWQYLRSFAKDLSTSGVHDIAHFLGGKLYQEVSLAALDQCDASFAFGCYHGVLEELIRVHGITQIESAVTHCNKFAFDTMITCYHGIGHGILPFYKYALPPALILCDQILPEETASYCYRGVFMEHALELSNKAKKENALWPCNEITNRYKASCYDYQMIYLSYIFPNSPEDVAQSCQEAEKEEYTTICLEGIGHMLAQTTAYDSSRISNGCRKMDEKAYARCMIAAAIEVVFQTNDTTKAEQICSRLRDAQRKECAKRSIKQIR